MEGERLELQQEREKEKDMKKRWERSEIEGLDFTGIGRHGKEKGRGYEKSE